MLPLESLLRTFVQLHPEDAARAFENLEIEEGVRLLRKLPPKTAIPLIERISPHATAQIISQLDAARVAEMLMELPPRVASSVLHQLDDAARDTLEAKLPESVTRTLLALAKYPPDTAGGLMDPRVASLSSDLSAQEATLAIRRAPREALHYLYVTGRDGKLEGVVTMRDLLLSKPRDPIAAIVQTNITFVPDVMPSGDVVELMREKKFLALPVVDFEGRLVGVVKQADAMAAGQVSAFESLQKIVGAGADERALSPVSMVVKSRLPWLYVNLVTAFMAAAVIGIFEGTIARVAALAVLLPVVAGQGGNTGSQSLAVVMRGLALREVISGTHHRLIRKELAGGMINGVAVAIVTAIAVFAWRLLAGDSLTAGFALSMVIGLAMIVNMAAAAIAGAVIPLVLQALGRDPAQSAAIFLTTVTDIVGFAAFLGFASMFMSWIT